MRIAEVFVNIPVKSIAKAYSYLIPSDMDFLSAGWRVLVPFGGRRVEGFIVNVSDGLAADVPADKLKPIIGTMDDEAWFTPEMIGVSREIADFYMCAPAEIMRLFMPGKSGMKIEVKYAVCEECGQESANSDTKKLILQVETYSKVYEIIAQKKILSMSELKKELPEMASNMESIVERLLSYKMLQKVYNAKKRSKELYQQILCPVNIDDEMLATLSRRPAQKRLAEYLRDNGDSPVSELKKLGFSQPVIKALVEDGFATIKEKRIFRDSYQQMDSIRKKIELTEEQSAALNELEPSLLEKNPKVFLLHGVTGSGKTQVYIEAAEKVRRQGRCVIVLVPEIALTGQLVSSFKAYFEGDIIVMHSRLTVNERNDAILKVRRGEAGVIIGARSALFTPAENIGLIIMDEEQDMSYKQDESPRYHARSVAKMLANHHGATLILGSATPSLETYGAARAGRYTLLTMKNRIGNISLPKVECVDMREELRRGNRHILSNRLKELIEDTIAKHEQVILMLNRRGFSTFVMCRECGQVMKCSICGMPMVYHRDGKLMCHHCDVREPVPNTCPKCGSRYIKYFGSGTEKLEQELREIVPQARVIRMDRDTTNGKFAHSEILDKFRRKEYDILLGTQMVAKGHDIPNVTAVGIISADSSLNMPDFRAAERCFMLITQTAGRAGRGEVPGQVVVQSYNPEHYAVKAGIAQDYEFFAQEELKMRRSLFFPPYSRLIKLIVQNTDEAAALNAAKEIAAHFKSAFPEERDKNGRRQQLIGPSPAMIAKFRDTYRFCLLIKTEDVHEASIFLRNEGLHLEPSVAIDVDPISTM